MLQKHIDRISFLFAKARNKVTIVSAFIGADTFNQLLSQVSPRVPIQVFTRWRLADLASGATDPEIFDIAARYKAVLKAHINLHAKMYIADEHVLVGSSNATASGLGTSKNPNLEFLTETQFDNQDVQAMLSILNNEARPAKSVNINILKQINIAIKTKSDFDDCTDNANWIPAANVKEVLSFLNDNKVSSNAIRDCIALGLPMGMTKKEIKKVVNKQKIFELLLNAAQENVVGLTMHETVNLVSDNYHISTNQAIKSFPIIVDWIRNFIDGIYVIQPPNGELMLCPWQKIDTS